MQNDLSPDRAGKISFLALCALSAALPFDFRVGMIIFPAIAMLSWLFRKDRSVHPWRLKILFYMTGLFATCLIWSVPALKAFHSFSFFEKALPFLFFPVACTLTPLTVKHKQQILLTFVIALVASYNLSLARAYYNFNHAVSLWGRQSDFFFHRQFTEGLLGMHPTYYGLMGNLATCFSFYVLENKWRLAVPALLTIFIILIDARIILILQIGILVYHFGRDFVKNISWKRAVIAILAIGAVGILVKVSSSIYDYKHRQITADIDAAWQRSFQPDISDGTDGGVVVRMAIWRQALNVIGQHPFFGVGFGLETQTLSAEYTRNSYNFLAQSQLNAHNQLLSHLISFGLIGTALFLGLLTMIAIESLRNQQKLFIEFIIVVGIVCMTESILNRLTGITVFVFFNSLLPFAPQHYGDE